jgi:hypothetical protein
MINWDRIVSEVGLENLENFCNGGLSGKCFAKLSTAAARSIRNFGVENVRQRARHALYRRRTTSFV